MQFYFQITEERKGCWVISLDHEFSSLEEADKGIDEISWALGIEPLPPVVSSLGDVERVKRLLEEREGSK
jgi:hypothetical protein